MSAHDSGFIAWPCRGRSGVGGLTSKVGKISIGNGSQVNASWMEESNFMVEVMGTRGFGPRLCEVRST